MSKATNPRGEFDKPPLKSMGFLPVYRLTPASDRWSEYRRAVDLPQIRHEAVTLDPYFCPSAAPFPIDAEDWQNFVMLGRNGFVRLFLDDPDVARARVSGGFDARYHRLIAVVREPTESDWRVAEGWLIPRSFEWLGFDLVEDLDSDGGAITKRSRFPLALRAEDLSQYGLVDTLERALEIRAALAQNYPEDIYADCSVWALWTADPIGPGVPSGKLDVPRRTVRDREMLLARREVILQDMKQNHADVRRLRLELEMIDGLLED